MDKLKEMENNNKSGNKTFEDIKHVDENGNEFWYARDLQKVLQYAKWQKFLNVIEKAKEACNNSGYKIRDHFTQVGKMVNIGSGAEREKLDYKLSRYASYLIVQNSDPNKEVVALRTNLFCNTNS